VYPHLVESYFPEDTQRTIFKKIKQYAGKYSKQPAIDDIRLLVETDAKISEKQTDQCYEFLDVIAKTKRVKNQQLLIAQVEEFCQMRAIELAVYDVMKSLSTGKAEKGAIEEVIKKALAIEFDVKIGHDYFKDAKQRMLSYLEDEDKIPLDIELINNAMGGGLVRKSIFIFMANTNVGKTVWLCHCTASLIRSGKNVLYISAEMSEKEINKRVDANMLDIPIGQLSIQLDKKLFKSRFKSLVEKTHGQLIVKEVGAGAMNALHLKNLLHEIKLKKGFLPDVIVMDHLTLFASTRLPAAQTGTHTYVQCVSEEMRAVAKEFDMALLTAAQFNRAAKKAGNDVGSEDVGLGYGISQTSDWSGALIQGPELKEQNKYILKTIKTRFDSNNDSYYTVGIKYEHMRLYNLDAQDQEIPMHIKDRLKMAQQKTEEEELETMFDYST
jgi:replicative DNA helicase